MDAQRRQIAQLKIKGMRRHWHAADHCRAQWRCVTNTPSGATRGNKAAESPPLLVLEDSPKPRYRQPAFYSLHQHRLTNLRHRQRTADTYRKRDFNKWARNQCAGIGSRSGDMDNASALRALT